MESESTGSLIGHMRRGSTTQWRLKRRALALLPKAAYTAHRAIGIQFVGAMGERGIWAVICGGPHTQPADG